jgi:hypothetical protein
MVDLTRVQAVLHRIAAGIDELARARRVEELHVSAVLKTDGQNDDDEQPQQSWSSRRSTTNNCPTPLPLSSRMR